MENIGLIYKKIAEVMQKISAVEKSRNNSQQGYKFRGIDDVYNALHNTLADVGVFTVPTVLNVIDSERSTKNGGVLICKNVKVSYKFYAEDGSFVEAIVQADGMDSGDKAIYKALAGAHKYALLQVFCIPTEELKDAENDTQELQQKTHVSDEQKMKDYRLLIATAQNEIEYCDTQSNLVSIKKKMVTSFGQNIPDELKNAYNEKYNSFKKEEE